MKCIKKLVALTLAAVLALTMLTACGGNTVPGTSGMAESEQKIVNAINAVRTKNGLSALKINEEVTEIARKKENIDEQQEKRIITFDEYKKQMKELHTISVEGRSFSGFETKITRISVAEAMTEGYWQKVYDEGDRGKSSVKIVTDPNTVYIGISSRVETVTIFTY